MLLMVFFRIPKKIQRTHTQTWAQRVTGHRHTPKWCTLCTHREREREIQSTEYRHTDISSSVRHCTSIQANLTNWQTSTKYNHARTHSLKHTRQTNLCAPFKEHTYFYNTNENLLNVIHCSRARACRPAHTFTSITSEFIIKLFMCIFVSFRFKRGSSPQKNIHSIELWISLFLPCLFG